MIHCEDGVDVGADGIPPHYELFSGNTIDKEISWPIIGDVWRNYL